MEALKRSDHLLLRVLPGGAFADLGIRQKTKELVADMQEWLDEISLPRMIPWQGVRVGRFEEIDVVWCQGLRVGALRKLEDAEVGRLRADSVRFIINDWHAKEKKLLLLTPQTSSPTTGQRASPGP